MWFHLNNVGRMGLLMDYYFPDCGTLWRGNGHQGSTMPWYSHIKQQWEAQFNCTGVWVSQLDSAIQFQCATNEEEASHWLTDWSHSPFNSDDEDRDCQNVGFLLNSDMALENFCALIYHRSLCLPFTFGLTSNTVFQSLYINKLCLTCNHIEKFPVMYYSHIYQSQGIKTRSRKIGMLLCEFQVSEG
jgi:hypothetical protein